MAVEVASPSLSLLLAHDRAAREYLLALRQGRFREPRPDVGKWTNLIAEIEERVIKAKGDLDAIERVFATYLRIYPDLALLLQERPSKIETKSALRPALPETARIALKPSSSEAYRLLKEYAEFSKKASPEGYQDFHPFCGLWMLSVVAARRVYVHLGRDKIYTNLRIVLCAESTDWAKSFTANVARSVLKEAGLDHLLFPRGKVTSEKLLSNMSGKWLPPDYSQLSREKQQRFERRLAMAGQKGIYWDEFGKFLQSMTRETSPMANFQDILLQLDDCQTNGADTIGRGDETVERPYLTTLGSLVPSTMKRIARAGSQLWQDGFFARCGFVCAPQTGSPDNCVSTGYISAPSRLIAALQEWNEALGEAEIDITEGKTSNGKSDGKLSITIIRELPEYEYILSEQAEAARKAYRSALKKLCNGEDVPADLKASYIRLATTALRIALLLASLEQRGESKPHPTIELSHWTAAQWFTELLRENLHRFYAQVNDYQTHAARMEDKIMAIIERQTSVHQAKGERWWFTPRDVRNFLNGALSTKEIIDILQSLRGRLESKSSRANGGYSYSLLMAEAE